MGTAVSCRYTESRRVPEYYIGAPFTGRLEHSEGKEIRGHYDKGIRSVYGIRKTRKILDLAVYVWIVEKNTAKLRA